MSCLCLTEWLTIGLPVCLSVLCLRPLASQSVCVSTYLPVCRSCVYDVCVCLSVSLQERRISQSFWQPNIDIVSLLICHFRFFSVLRWLRVSVNDRQYSGLLSRFLRRKLSWRQIRTEWVQWNFPAFALYYYFVSRCADFLPLNCLLLVRFAIIFRCFLAICYSKRMEILFSSASFFVLRCY